MAWKKITGDIEYYKFAKEGDTLEGFWRGVQPSNKEGYAPNGKIQVEGQEAVQAFGLSAVLRLMSDIPLGTKVKVVYLGRERSKNGQDYKNYEVFVDDPDHEQNDSPSNEVPF